MKSSLPILGLAFTFFIFGCSKMNYNRAVPAAEDLIEDLSSKKKPKKKAEYVEGAYIVVFKKHIKDVDFETDDLGKTHKIKTKHRFKHAIKGFAGEMAPELVELLRMDPRVDYIEQDQLISIENSQYNPPSWGLDRTDQRALPLSGSYNYN